MDYPAHLKDRLEASELDHIEQLLVRQSDGRTAAHYSEFRLESHFQPVYSIAHGRTVGFEALVRAHDANHNSIPPQEVFSSATHFPDLLMLDRLTRTMHLDNFRTLERHRHWLFLNVHPEVFIEDRLHGEFLSQLLTSRKIQGERIVLEVLEESVDQEVRLARAVDYYRRLGCLIALDNFGAGHSNFDRVWNLQPDIVKLDRAMTAQAATNSRVARMLPVIVSLMHEAGALVLMEGVETEREAQIAMECDIDLVQGYFFSRPQLTPVDAMQKRAQFEKLWDEFRERSTPRNQHERQLLLPYQDALKHTSTLMESGMSVDAAANGFLDLPHSERCFLLDAEGVQLGDTLLPLDRLDRMNPRFFPLDEAAGANWSRRYYFRRALENLGVVQTSRPYLSMVGARPCVTLSIAIRVGNETLVLCGDVAHDELEANAKR